MIGRTVLHYEIIETLGHGGMGVVYKARDTHLDRFVAIKVLPPEKVADVERKRRFVQEAKAASALNHPNIIHIYDIAEADEIQFIAMEYVPGKTLDQLIGRKGLRLNETLKYAVQISDALAKAHSSGIVHRDLKPSNVMVTGDGLVKVLDFGLAKLTERASGEFGETATMQQQEKPDTAEGTIVGTVAYMSPEQAEGKPVDARSDLFAFGSLLYEMVTGQRAFQGASKLSTLSAILKEEPKAVAAVVAGAPRDLEKIIARCLRKDPARRFQHTDDLKIALAELKEESDSGTAAGAQTRARAGPRKARFAWIYAAFAAVVFAALGLWLWVPAQTPRPAPKVVPLTSYPGDELSPSFSPDGNQVAFTWNTSSARPATRQRLGTNYHVYLKLIGGSDPVRLTHDPANEFSPAWSPDGRFIAFLRILSANRAGVFLIPVIGGRERKLAEVSPDSDGLAWFPDSRWLVVADRASLAEPPALFLLSVESGEKARLTAPPAKCADSSPAVSPDGRALVFARFTAENISDLFLLQLSENLTPKGEPRRLTFENRYSNQPAWTPDGRAIVFSSGVPHTPGLWQIALSRREWRATNPEHLPFAGEGVRQPAISRRGQLAFAQTTIDVDIWRLELNGGRPAERPAIDLISSTRVDHDARYSPDGKRIVFGSNRSGSFEIWVCNSDGSNAVQLTSFASSYYPSGPTWSPDGGLIYFHYNVGGKKNVYVISSEGGRPKRLDLESVDSWSRDGKSLYFSSKRSGEEQIWKMPANGGNAVQVTRKGGSDAVESFDSRYVYYLKTDTGGKISVWRLPLGGGEESKVLESVVNNNFAVVDRGIYFIPDIEPFSIQFLSFGTDKAVTIAKVAREPSFGFSVSPDGRSLIYAEYEAVRSDLMMVENFR